MVKIPIFFDQEKQGMTMHVKGFLHKMLLSVMHKKRLDTLTLLVITALQVKKLSLTGLARGIDLCIQERSAIRRVDRFLGNTKLHKERVNIYRLLINRIVGNHKRLWIIVDWSEVPTTSDHILRAAIIADGRAITIYEEIHPEKKLSNPKIEKKFLWNLKEILPEGSKPVIVTDAGFHNKWFSEVLSLGWDYIGRVRCGKKYSQNDGKTWHKYTKLFPRATSTPQSLGKVKLCRNNVLGTNLYLFKGKAKGRSLLNRVGKKRRDTNSMDHRKSGREAWVLASSLSGRGMASRVVKIYKKRMQIEEGFRDLKSSRYGFGFEDAYSRKRERIAILLLIASLASFVAWITGWAAEKSGLHLQFQSNSIQNRRVLSFFYLGCQVIKRKIKIPPNILEKAINRGLTYA
jgi:Transposase DDE domain